MFSRLYAGPYELAYLAMSQTFRLFAQNILFSEFVTQNLTNHEEVKAPMPPEEARGLIVSMRT